jgi:protoporphyrinogen oxidase
MSIGLSNGMQNSKPQTAIVGAGMLGLTLAYRLLQQNIDVTLIESTSEVGGLTQSQQIGDLSWDKYYHVTMLSDNDLRSLLVELDLEREINWKVSKTHFFTGKGLYPLNNAIDYLRLPIMGFIDKIRLGLTIIYASRLEQGKALELLSARDWLTRLSGAKAYQQLWKPLLRAKLGNNYGKVSAAFIWAVIRRFYAARRGGLKTEMFGYVPGGYQRIIAKMLEKMRPMGLKIITGAPVSEVTGNDQQRLLVIAGEQQYQFDKVVLTCPSDQVTRLCSQLTENEKKRHSNVLYQGIVCPSVLLRKSLGGAYLTYITDDNIPFTAVIEMSSLVDFDDAAHPHLVYLPKYVPSDDPLFELTDEQIKQQFSKALIKMYPFLDVGDILDIRVSRTRQVVALSTLHYSENLADYRTSIKGLYVINSAQINNASLSVQETVKLANDKAVSLLQDFDFNEKSA